MSRPTDLRYTREHEWVRVEDGVGTVGITDYAQDQLGDIVYLNLPPVSSEVRHTEKFGEIESVKAVSDLYSPVSGEVVEVNQAAIDRPELVNQSPFGEGWMIKVQLRDRGELDRLITAEQYDEYVAEAEG